MDKLKLDIQKFALNPPTAGNLIDEVCLHRYHQNIKRYYAKKGSDNNFANLVVDSIRTKNMCNISSAGLFTNGSGTVVADSAYYNAIIDVSNISSVYVSGDFTLLADSMLRIGKFNSYPVVSLTGTRLSPTSNGVINTSDCKYLLLSFAPASSSISLNQIKSSFMVEEGTTATTYAPYQNLTGQENYSTGETIIGTWIDGKPIYRQVIDKTGTVNANTWFTIKAMPNVDNITYHYIIFDYGITGSYLCRVWNNNFEIYVKDRLDILKVIVEYTKTTD